MKTKISDIADIQVGYQFRKRLHPQPDGSHCVIQAADIDEADGHRLLVRQLVRLTPDRDAAKWEVSDGDVIFLSRGRRNFATMIENLPQGCRALTAGHFHILRRKANSVAPEYLVWAINAPAAQAYIRSAARGSAMPFISKDVFAELEIDLPPLHVQERIVRLHSLSLHEQRLMQRLQQKRAEIVKKVCIKAVRQHG